MVAINALTVGWTPLDSRQPLQTSETKANLRLTSARAPAPTPAEPLLLALLWSETTFELSHSWRSSGIWLVTRSALHHIKTKLAVPLFSLIRQSSSTADSIGLQSLLPFARKMQSKAVLSYVFAALLTNSIECQQMVNLLRTAASNPSPSQSPPPQQGQPQLLSLEQQQQLLQQLAALTAAQQQRQQPSPYGQQNAQQFFDPSQPPFFGPQGGQGPPQQFFAPQEYTVQPQQAGQQGGPTQPPSPAINWGNIETSLLCFIWLLSKTRKTNWH